MKNYRSMAAASVMLLLLAACGSSGIGDILGGGNNGDDARSYEIRGIVDSVDVNGQSLYLTNVSGYQSMLSNGGSSGSAVRVYFDDQTEVDYQGRGYQVRDLERGDEVRIRVDESGNRLMADLVTVERDISSGTNSGSNNNNYPTYGSTLRGTVRYVDMNRGTIEIDRGNGTSVAEFNLNTPVFWNNQSYRVSDLERGDEIEIRYRDLGSNRLQATEITVLRNISEGSSGSGVYGSTNTSTLRGTVRYVDTSRRTIQLESTSWRNNFNSGSGNTGGVITISYDTNTSVDVSGRLHPVSGLERGDIIEVSVRNLGGSSYHAERVFLVRDVNAR